MNLFYASEEKGPMNFFLSYWIIIVNDPCCLSLVLDICYL